MDDLGLFARLRRGELDDAATLATALDELARQPLLARWPFFALLTPCLTHDDAEVRAAALRALRQADGLPALHALVDALDDADETVRAAAVAALAASTRAHPWRFAHAIFHGRVDVRRAALAAEVGDEARSMFFYLAADPELGDEIRRRIRARSSPLDPPATAIAVVIELGKRGLLSPDDVRSTLIRNATWVLHWARTAPARDPARIQLVFHECATRDAPPSLERELGADAVDDLVELFAGAPEAEARPFWRAIGEHMHVGDAVLVRRLYVSLLRAAHRSGDATLHVSTAALTLMALHQPMILGFRWIPAAERRAAVHALPGISARLAKRDPVAIVAMLWAEPFHDGHGHPELRAVVALLETVKQPWKALVGALSAQGVVDAIARDPDDAGWLLALPDDGTGTRAPILPRAAAEDPAALTRALAFALLRAPNAAAVLEGTSPEQQVRVLAALIAVTGAPGHTIDAKRASGIVEAFAASLLDVHAADALRAWLTAATPETHELGLALVGALGRRLETGRFVQVTRTLPPPLLVRLTRALPSATTFPWGKQLALAEALTTHADPELAAWAAATLAPPDRTASRPSEPPAIDAMQALEITTAAHAHLPRVLDACLAVPHRGVARALAGRAAAGPSAAACTALLLSRDPIGDVARELARFASPEGTEIDEAARAVCAHADEAVPPGLAGRAALWRWESHARAVLAALESDALEPAALEHGSASLAASIRVAAGWRTPRLGSLVLACIASWCRDARYRDPAALARRATPEVVAALVDAIRNGPPDVACEAARALAAMHASRAAVSVLAQVREAVAALLPECDATTRDALESWIESDGLPPPPPRPAAPLLGEDALRGAIRASHDVAWLTTLATSTERRVADEGVVRLVELDGGPAALAALLAGTPLPPHADAIAESVALWPPTARLDEVVALVRRADAPVAVRFRAALALLERGRDEPAFLERGHDALADQAIALAAAPCDPRSPFFRASDFDALVRCGIARERLAMALAPSAQPHAYRPAVETLAAMPRADALPALRLFVAAGTARIGELRRRAAHLLDEAGDESALPLVLADALRSAAPADAILARRSAEVATVAARSLLVAGPRVASDKQVDKWLNAPGVSPEAQLEVLPDLLVMARDDQVRALAAKRLARPDRRARKLRDVAETFAWGIARGRELTGRLFDVRMIGGRAWGYTRFDSSAVHVTTLPILQRARWGKQIVEGLILHEIGHHMYHRGPRAKEVWAEATRAGMHGVLNLVADEHLERNLRAIDPAYGDRLKRLAAHAFQHADKEVAVLTLLVDLSARAFAVLTASPLRVARDDESVSLSNGELLLAMERAGLSFPRFVRALRMGLGDRHDDPKVREALELFASRGFRGSSMDDLWKIAQRMKDIFGWEVKLIEQLGAPESLEPGDAEETVHGEGITDADVSGEVERVLDPRGGQRGSSGPPGGKRWVNVNPEESFDTIDKVVAVKHDAAAHGELARQVARPARTMRALLEHLGLAAVPERRRLTGHAFDRTRARALVLLGDPHVLIARPVRSFDDLFLGLVIDCSGSMSSRGNMDRAKRFATLLAEAARGLPGVTVRVYGFTDKVIYEAGTADRCAAHALVANGGNNDAAALWYAMGVARASRRKAKMLVMISDGLPTECSVAALRAVVRRGKREGVLCAQIAVQPLAEVCFPHYVVVDDEDLDAAARKFGAIAAKLVRTALSTT